MTKNINKEVIRRRSSYMNDMGVTGQMILFIRLLSRRVPRFHWSDNMHTFLKALPDQEVLASQKRSGLDLFNGYLWGLDEDEVRRLYYFLTKPLLEPEFLETFFTCFPWHLPLPESDQTIESILDAPLPLLLPPTGGDVAIFRLLSLRNLPQNNPCWSDVAKSAFSRFLDLVVEKVRAL